MERITIDNTIHYIEKYANTSIMKVEFYAVLRFLQRENRDRLAGYGGPYETCRLFGWVVGHGGGCMLTDLGTAALETEIAAREARGEDLDPDPLVRVA